MTAQMSVRRSDLLERIFLFSVDHDVVPEERKSDVPSYCTFMVNFMNEDGGEPIIPFSDLRRMIFDRTMSVDLISQTVNRHANTRPPLKSDHPHEHPIVYLLTCYERIFQENQKDAMLKEVVAESRKIIVENIRDALLSPDVYGAVLEFLRESSSSVKSIHDQFWTFIDDSYHFGKGTIFYSLMQDLSTSAENEDVALKILSTCLTKMCDCINQNNLGTVIQRQVMILDALVDCDKFAPAILKYRYQPTTRDVQHYRYDSLKSINSLLLAKTSMIVSDAEEHTFYNNSQPQMVTLENDTVHYLLSEFHKSMYLLFKKFIRKSETNNTFLSWVGKLLHENNEAGKLWTHQMSNPHRNMDRTDAIFINLAAVFVRLAIPFCLEKNGESNERWLKIDPSYCIASTKPDYMERGIHLQGMKEITHILKSEEANILQTAPISPKYNFISDCFFLTHRALYNGLHGLLSKIKRLNRELGHLQEAYTSNMLDEELKERFTRAISVFNSAKGLLIETEFVDNFTRFQLTTARYLNQMAFTSDRTRVHDIPFPLVGSTESLLMLPEFIVENFIEFILFFKRYHRNALQGFSQCPRVLLDLISIFMGNQSRMNNPHLRANLAEVLETILPIEEDPEVMEGDEDYFQGENPLNNFAHVGHIVVSSLQLYVDIEFTGDVHQFEEKFNYRRPLYAILKFLWNDPRGRLAVKELSLESIANIEAASPPLMLRFVNLFLNDAVFLLDEAISHLTKIKQEEKDRDGGEWETLPAREKAEKEKLLKQMVMICRYHNVMANKTVETLGYMSTADEFKQLLCHNVLVDRIAGMLNYFLQHLVGPKMGALKVKNLGNCEFKPKELVSGICKIYNNLGGVEVFCRAISQDGRSYNEEMFPNTINVLKKIGSHSQINGILLISEKAKEFTKEGTNEEEMFEGAPDCFFDPITSCVMHDPVILPSSKVTVDRTTIARHLLSDTTDPFNRSPLSMEQVTCDSDLSRQIQKFIADKKQGVNN